MEKRRINKKGIFIFVSFISMIAYICFYGIRLVHYYLEENPIKKTESGNQTVTYLSNQALTGITLENSESGLFYDKTINEYYYKGKDVNNYLYYSGRLWRIISIDSSNNTMRIITDENQIITNYKEKSNFDDSYIKSWMDNVFTQSLYNKTTYLTKTKSCDDKIDDLSNITCNSINNNYDLTLLSLYDYNRSGAADGFVNNDSYFWLMTENNKGDFWYVFNKGGVKSESNKNSKFYGVKVVATLASKINATYGDGTKSNPYYFEDDKDGELKNRNIGEYLSYAGYTWRIIGQEEDKTKLIMDGYVKIGEENVSLVFSEKKNTFDLSDKSGIASYLINTFYSLITIENNYIVPSSFANDKLNINKYSYENVGKDVIETKVALPSLNDYFATKYPNVFLINASSEDDNLVFTVNESGNIYLDNYNKKKYIRPIIYIDSTLYALSNDGTKEKPYVIGR